MGIKVRVVVPVSRYSVDLRVCFVLDVELEVRLEPESCSSPQILDVPRRRSTRSILVLHQEHFLRGSSGGFGFRKRAGGRYGSAQKVFEVRDSFEVCTADAQSVRRSMRPTHRFNLNVKLYTKLQLESPQVWPWPDSIGGSSTVSS